MWSKKGIGLVLSEVWSILLFVILLAIFIFYFTFPGITKDKTEEVSVIDSFSSNEQIFVLESYLNTPVDDSRTISDLISLWLKDNSYEEQLKEETKEIFDPVYGDCYGVKILDFEVGRVSNTEVCVDFPDYGSYMSVCFDNYEYTKKMNEGEESKCF